MKPNIAVVATREFSNHDQLCNHLRSIHYQVVYCCDSLGTFIEEWTSANALDVIILGIKQSTGFDQISKLKQLIPNIHILVFASSTHHDDLTQALQKGANGYYLAEEGFDMLDWAIKKILSGGVFIAPELNHRLIEQTRLKIGQSPHGLLSAKLASTYGLNTREIEIGNLLVQQLSYKEIAQLLYLSINTVRHYVKTLYKKLNVSNKNELKQKLLSQQ